MDTHVELVAAEGLRADQWAVPLRDEAIHPLGEDFDPPVHVTNMGLNATEANKENFLKKKPVIGPGQQIRVRELEEHLSKTRPGSFEHAKVWAQITTIARETAEYISKSR